jgi:putative salt-induced outer membrane protein YdiY
MPRLWLALLLLTPSLASADRVTVKGTVLEGDVQSISADEIVLKTVYGKGDLTIETKEVSAIETDTPFHVYKADDGTEVGRIVGITTAAVTLARADGSHLEVPFEQVQAAPRDAGPEANWFERRPVESPWWSGNVDLSFASFDAATHTTALATGFGVRRERGPDRTRFAASYLRSSTREDEDDPDTTDFDESDKEITADELRGLLRHEHDFTARVFGFGSLEAEHDGIENLSIRLIPKVGAGYKLVNLEDFVFSVDAGVAYVYQKYFGGDTESFTALAFGAQKDWDLPWLGATWYTRVDYLPSITDPGADYRLRGETALLIPIVEQLALKASVIDEYNSQPADDAVSNSLATLLGLSLVY